MLNAQVPGLLCWFLKKVIRAKEKLKLEDTAQSDKVCYAAMRAHKELSSSLGNRKGKKETPIPPSAFCLLYSEQSPKIKGEHPGLSVGNAARKLGEMWSEQSVEDKPPYDMSRRQLS